MSLGSSGHQHNYNQTVLGIVTGSNQKGPKSSNSCETGTGSIDLEEYMPSVTSYISKCIDDVTISKTITPQPETVVDCRSEGAAYKYGEEATLRKVTAELSQAIKTAKRTYAQKIHNHFTDTKDTPMARHTSHHQLQASSTLL